MPLRYAQAHYQQILDLVTARTGGRTPHAKLARVFTALLPRELDTCYSWKPRQAVAELILGTKGLGFIETGFLIRNKLENLLGPATTLDEMASRVQFVWWLYENREAAAGDAVVQSATGTPEEITLKLWPATKQLRGIAKPVSDAALLVIADDPCYARVHRLSRLILSPHFNPTVAHERPAPLRQTFDLYELWSFIEVQRQLSQLWPEAQWMSKGLENLLDQSGNGGGAQYSAHLRSGRKIVIDFNPTFASYWARRSRPRWSLSKERRPDIMVAASGGDDQPRWLFLDAKYRVSRDRLGEAFESVHLYRDSLRDDNHGGSCVAGALVCPRSREDTSFWFASAFRDEHRCGVFELNPSRKQDELARWVASTLGT